MNYNEFVTQVVQDLRAQYEIDVHTQDVNKVNGESYRGLAIPTGKAGLSACLNLDVFFEGYKRNGNYEEALQDVFAAVQHAAANSLEIDVEKLKDYASMKHNLMIQLVPVTGNEKLLLTVPHHIVGDVALVYRMEMSGILHEGRTATTLITNEHVRGYGITEEQLHQDALESAASLHPASFRSLFSVLSALPEMAIEDQGDNGAVPIYVATCEGGIWGAATLAYPGFLESVAEKLGGNFYILPSSIHETLMLPENETHMSYRDLEQMVREINQSEVRPQDRLSDHVYHYDAREKLLELASDYVARTTNRGIEVSQERPSLLAELSNKRSISYVAISPNAAEVLEKKTSEKLHGGRER